MKVEVRPIERVQWHGKKGKDSFTAPKKIEAFYDANTGKYATGMTVEEQKKYGEMLGVDLSDTFHPDKPHPFYSTQGVIKLPNNTEIFDTSKTLDLIKVKIMKANPLVANSLKDIQLYPEATHVIYDEQEEVAEKSTKIQRRNKAIIFASQMSKEDKINLVMVAANKAVRNQSDEYIDVEVDKIIENDLTAFVKYAKMEKAEASVRAKITECLQKNILTKEGVSIFFVGDKIALDFEGAVEYFMNPQNQQMKATIFEKLSTV